MNFALFSAPRSSSDTLIRISVVMAHVPLFMDFRDRCIVIFGGRHIVERQAKMIYT
jgi:hypothetical protein